TLAGTSSPLFICSEATLISVLLPRCGLDKYAERRGVQHLAFGKNLAASKIGGCHTPRGGKVVIGAPFLRRDHARCIECAFFAPKHRKVGICADADRTLVRIEAEMSSDIGSADTSDNCRRQ